MVSAPALLLTKYQLVYMYASDGMEENIRKHALLLTVNPIGPDAVETSLRNWSGLLCCTCKAQRAGHMIAH